MAGLHISQQERIFLMKKIFAYGNRDEYINYANAVEGVGGEIVMSTDISDSADCDALLLLGGGDINPKVYGCENTASVGINDTRDEDELALIKNFYEAGKPIFGICRGHQIVAVYFGSKMIQHIDNAERHTRTKENKDNVHMIKAVEGSFLYNIYGSEFPVNSSHHQGVESVPEGFTAAAWSDDGILDGMQNDEHRIYTTQFHPERMCFANRREDTVDGKAIFEFFLSKI